MFFTQLEILVQIECPISEKALGGLCFVPIPNNLTVPERLLPSDLPGQVGGLAFHKPCELRMRGVGFGPLFRIHLSPVKHLGLIFV